MSRIQLAEGLTLPLDIITQTIAILAKRRAGKSYTARRLAEQLLHARQQVVIVDPKGDHWGIRSARDGRSPGFQVVIFGGERGDLPLSVGDGEQVARTVAEERVNMLLDLSLFRKAEVATFMTGFLENLYRLKAREANRTPVMLIVDEADAIAPQKPQSGQERMLGAADDIVRRGGQRGIGCALITQRSAVLNKNVLTQAQMLVVLRTIAPQDIAAMLAWIDVHGTKEQGRQLIESLPSLPIGQAWFWSPGWPTDSGIFKRATVLPIDTFDSGATPKPGEKRAEPKNLADVDIDALKKQMAATIERAKENDPKELKRQVADLKRELTQLRATPAPAAKVETKVKVIEKPVLKEKDLKRIDAASAAIDRAFEVVRKFSTSIELIGGGVIEVLNKAEKAPRLPAPAYQGMRTMTAPGRATPDGVVLHQPKPFVPPARRGSPSDAAAGLTLGERKMLSAIALADVTTGGKAAILSGYSIRSSTFRNILSGLRTKGLISGNRDGFSATDAGISALGDAREELPQGEELRQYWRNRVGDGVPGRVFGALLEVHPGVVSRDALAEASGTSASSSTYRNALSKLRVLGLIESLGSGITAARDLFR